MDTKNVWFVTGASKGSCDRKNQFTFSSVGKQQKHVLFYGF